MKDELSEVVDTSTEWMLSQIKPDGSYKDTLPTLGAYYKTPYLWAASGRPIEFGRSVQYMKDVFYDLEGFHSEEDPQAKVYTDYMFNYMMAWVARGAWLGGAFDFARAAYDYLVQPEGKYIRATCDQGPEVDTRTRNIGSTSNAGVSFLYAGDLSSAEHCADFVWDVFDQQNLEDEFFLRTDSDGNILRDFPDDEQAISVIDMNEPDQMYWYLGISMAFFAKLYKYTSQKEYLERANSVFQVFDRCRENVADDDLSVGKVAYGTAILYRLTEGEKYLEVCRECSDNLIQNQQSEGYWLYERRGDIKELNRSTLLDFCAEMTIWSIEINKELSQVE